ncbi:MAG TPA: hypothetical protein VEH27_12550 [Methylomirabilota bacterium]|nr:hypothetical protein [Methylomirabilota bacterium]
MGFLDFFSKREEETILKLPQGTFTIDKSGQVISSTIPSSFPQKYVKEISDTVLAVFRDSAAADEPLREFTVQFAGLKLNAKELRGGAMIYLSPRVLSPKKG